MEIIEAMNRANEISCLGLGRTFPNPIVGAVIISATGEFISEGFHARNKEDEIADHAEIVAIKSAGNQARGATLVLTLEPCNHHGKTLPCADAIISAGISKVIFAIKDPNKLAQGGKSKLISNGILVEEGLNAAEISRRNRAWLFKVSTGRPLITAKIAATVDGYIAAQDGSSKWITSEFSRRDVHLLRHQVDAVITGTGTVIADDPLMTVRDIPVITHQPERIVIGQRKLDSDAKIFNNDAKTTRIEGRNLDELISYCLKREFNHVLLEAGSKLTTAFLAAGLVDELYIYQAPTILGSGLKMIEDIGVRNLQERRDFQLRDSSMIGSGDGANNRLVLTKAGIH